MNGAPADGLYPRPGGESAARTVKRRAGSSEHGGHAAGDRGLALGARVVAKGA